MLQLIIHNKTKLMPKAVPVFFERRRLYDVMLLFVSFGPLFLSFSVATLQLSFCSPYRILSTSDGEYLLVDECERNDYIVISPIKTGFYFYLCSF